MFLQNKPNNWQHFGHAEIHQKPLCDLVVCSDIESFSPSIFGEKTLSVAGIRTQATSIENFI